MEANKLLEEACKVYGIDEKYVFAHTEYPETDEICVLTHGGKKFMHKKSEPAKFELTFTEITGQLSGDEKGTVWHKKLNQRVTLGGLGRLIKKHSK